MKYHIVNLDSNDEIPAKVRKSGFSHQRQPLVDFERRKKRDVANSNERRRMRCINNGFDQLKDCIPHLKTMDKISKASILSHACLYLNHMQEQIKLLNQSVQEARCLSCGHCPYFAAEPRHAPNNSCTWYKQAITPPLHVQVTSDLNVVSPSESAMESHTEMVPRSSEDKPNTPDSDSTSAASMQVSQVRPLSFTHLLQAVEFLHDIKFDTSPVCKDGQQRVCEFPLLSEEGSKEECVSPPPTQCITPVITSAHSVPVADCSIPNSTSAPFSSECRILPPRLKNKWHISSPASQITS